MLILINIPLKANYLLMPVLGYLWLSIIWLVPLTPLPALEALNALRQVLKKNIDSETCVQAIKDYLTKTKFRKF